MTITVTVHSRAWPASVVVKNISEGEEGHNIDESTTDLAPSTTKSFAVEEGQVIEVREVRPEEAKKDAGSHLPLDPTNVPGRAQNDELMAPIQAGDEDPESSDD